MKPKFNQLKRFTHLSHEVEIHVLHGQYCYRISGEKVNTLTPYQYASAWGAEQAAKKDLSKARFANTVEEFQVQMRVDHARSQANEAKRAMTEDFFARIAEADAKLNTASDQLTP